MGTASESPATSENELLRRTQAAWPSDRLQDFRSLMAELPALKQILGELLEIRLVIDANIAQKELRWRLRSRRNPNARSDLQEAIDSGTVVALAPMALKPEIEEHIEEIAEYAGVSVDRAREEWQEFQSRLHFYEPDIPQQPDAKCVGPDDLPYSEVSKQLGAQAVYTRDSHFQAMQAPVIIVNLDLALRNYARASSIEVGIKLASGLTLTVSLEVLSAALKGCVEFFKRLPNAWKLVLAGAVLVALAHPKCREKVASAARSVWGQLSDPKSPLLAVLAHVANELVSAQKTAREAYCEIQSVLPPTRKRSALVHARAICLINKEPLSIAEIERRMRNEGYISTSPNFTAYLRRVLRADRRFFEVSPGLWTLLPDTTPSLHPPSPTLSSPT